MTIESKPRIKITYATLRNDNEELHALYEAGVQSLRSGPGRAPPELRRWALGRRQGRDVRGPLADRLGDPPRDVRQGRPGGRGDAIAAARRAQPEWRRTPWRERLAILRRAAELISRAPDALGRATWRTRSARTGWRPSARSRRRPTSSATTPRPMEDNDGYDHPMDNLGDSAVHTRADPPAARRLRASSAPSTSRWPSPPGRSRPRSWPATRRSSSPPRRHRCRA